MDRIKQLHSSLRSQPESTRRVLAVIAMIAVSLPVLAFLFLAMPSLSEVSQKGSASPSLATAPPAIPENALAPAANIIDSFKGLGIFLPRDADPEGFVKKGSVKKGLKEFPALMLKPFAAAVPAWNHASGALRREAQKTWASFLFLMKGYARDVGDL